MRNPLSAFADRRRRPRAILWSGVVILLALGFYLGVNMVTSTKWFCNDVCHNVHADNAKAYFNASHRAVSCMACHYPVGMDPASLALDRADKLFDIAPAALNTVEMPLNRYSRIALSMPQTQCTQCHDMKHRQITPDPGIKIDHAVHDRRGIICTTCHNRVAHQELSKLTLKNNERHEDFSKMTACFRCHTLTGSSPSKYTAPGKCSTCHDADFKLTPSTHDAKNWYNAAGDSSGHAKAALAAIASSKKASEEWARDKEEFENEKPRILAQVAGKMAGYDESLKVEVPPVATINQCSTCHTGSFCSNCHGTQVPHPATFRTQHSKTYTKANAASCAKCHNRTHDPKYAADSCQQCHHQWWQPSKGTWAEQHGQIIHRTGLSTAKQCYRCHSATMCSQCHTEGRRPSY